MGSRQSQSQTERQSQSAWADGRRALLECLRLRESALHALNRTLAATHDKLARAEAAMGTSAPRPSSTVKEKFDLLK